ncbi:MAG: tRNA-(ms[2]io[6]A)-hydroxylase [Pseudomonadales bacterium]
MSSRAAIDDVLAFLPCATPEVWFQQARERLSTLLIDHANCEKKAAGTAMSLLYRYVDKPQLLQRLSRLAREELRHFEQVHVLMLAHGIDYVHLSPSRYAAGLMRCVRPQEPFRLADTLLMGAVVEARSCERFAGLVAVMPDDLASFYRGLLAAEARHFRHYLQLAGSHAVEPIEAKLRELLEADARLVTEPDDEFRFHSGPLRPRVARVSAAVADTAG